MGFPPTKTKGSNDANPVVTFRTDFPSCVVTHTGATASVAVPIITNLTSYTLTIGATTTPPTLGTVAFNEARWRRVGDCMELFYNLSMTSAGTAGSGLYLFPIPPTFAIDTAKLTPSTNGINAVVGSALVAINGGSGGGSVAAYDTVNLVLTTTSSGAGSPGVGIVGSATFPLSATSANFAFHATIPISGWTATT